MPLPDRSIPWPPKYFEPALELMSVYDAWYVGDIDQIGEKYHTGPMSHPAQMNGGLVGVGARAWLGKPQTGGERRARHHYPMAADIATLSADLLFSEPPRFVIPGATTTVDGLVKRSPVQERIEKIINIPNFQSTLLEAAEVQSALGGVYLRLVWDKANLKSVRGSVVHADNAIPEFLYGDLRAVTFWTELQTGDDKNVWRHLERHELGRIVHGVYAGDQSSLGMRMPFEDHPDTAWLAKLGLVEEDSLLTGVDDALTACYIPNMRPNKAFRKNSKLDALGKSDFADILDQLDEADEILSSWMRDIRLAKARIIVPSGYLQGRPGQGGSFDYDREVYEGLEFAGGDTEGGPFTMQQFDIRVADHEASLKNVQKIAVSRAGYAVASMGDAQAGMRTATEVKSDDRLSSRTRDKKTNYWRSLGEFAHTWLRIDAGLYGGEMPTVVPEVRFPAESQVDLEALSRTVQSFRSVKTMSIETAVRAQHPDWDGSTVNEEVARIKLEEGIGTAPDPAKLTGLDKTEASLREQLQQDDETDG